MKTDEIAQRSAGVAAVFDRVSDTYDTVDVPWFTPIAQRLVAELAPQSGERALDLGTGRGAALWPLAEAVGTTGRVTGLDLSSGMIRATTTDLEARGLDTVTLLVGDAADPEVPSSAFEIVVASLVLFFLPDPRSAVAAWRDRLAPGGRLGVSTFGPRDAAWSRLDDVFTPFLSPRLLDARTSGSRGPFASDEGMAELLTSGGFTQVRTLSYELEAHFTGLAQWRDWSWSHGQRTHWEAVPEEHRAPVLEDAAARLVEVQDSDGGFRLHQRVRYTFGRRTDAVR